MPVSFLSPAQRDSYGQYLGGPRPASRRWPLGASRRRGETVTARPRAHQPAGDATRSPYLNRSLGASSGRSETPLMAVANRTFRSIAPQTPRSATRRSSAGSC